MRAACPNMNAHLDKVSLAEIYPFVWTSFWYVCWYRMFHKCIYTCMVYFAPGIYMFIYMQICTFAAAAASVALGPGSAKTLSSRRVYLCVAIGSDSGFALLVSPILALRCYWVLIWLRLANGSQSGSVLLSGPKEMGFGWLKEDLGRFAIEL